MSVTNLNEGALSIDEILSLFHDSSDNNGGAFATDYSEFKKLFKYLINICRRYDHKCFLVMVNLVSDDSAKASSEELAQAMEAFDVSTRQSIRNVDVCTRFSDDKYLIILLDSGEENIKDIMERINIRYFKIIGETKLTPKYESKLVTVDNSEI